MTTSIPLRIPKKNMRILEKIAVLADTDVQTVIHVFMAMEIERCIKAGIIPRLRKKK